jgi:heme-degrading monooxygenase HmoA
VRGLHRVAFPAEVPIEMSTRCSARRSWSRRLEAQRIRGFRSIDLVRRERDSDVEFMTLMWFDTLDGLKEFMGQDYEAAHVPTQAQAVLADFDERAAHYQVLDHREQPR